MPKEVEEEEKPDPKIALDLKCESSCTKPFDAYEKCKERIEAKVRSLRCWRTARPHTRGTAPPTRAAHVPASAALHIVPASHTRNNHTTSGCVSTALHTVPASHTRNSHTMSGVRLPPAITGTRRVQRLLRRVRTLY